MLCLQVSRLLVCISKHREWAPGAVAVLAVQGLRGGPGIMDFSESTDLPKSPIVTILLIGQFNQPVTDCD